MKIAIIGAGNIGTVLTKRFSAVGHEVSVANSRGPETLAGLAAETGAKAAGVGEVADGAEVVVVTIPEGKVPELPHGVLDGAAEGAVVIDTGNYYPQRDGRIDAIENGTTESRWVSEQLGREVVKAFNTIQAQHLLELGKPAGTPGRVALPVAGDDPAAKAVVMRLVDEIGFDPVDSGGLDDSWRQQPGSPVYTKDLDAEGTRRALAEARPTRAAH
jgi:predicted dinucleotide-binding enzyme